jgi:hypothetical protein
MLPPSFLVAMSYSELGLGLIGLIFKLLLGADEELLGLKFAGGT